MKYLRFCLLWLMLIVMFNPYGKAQAASLASGQVLVRHASPQAMQYLNDALDYIQAYSVKTKQMDWPELRQEAARMAKNAQTTSDTYPAIRTTLQHLGDHHSFFIDPTSAKLVSRGQNKGFGFHLISTNVIVEIIPHSPADQAGLRERDTVLAINGTPPEKMSQDGINAALYRKSQIKLTFKHANQAQPTTLILNATAYDNYRPPFAQRLGRGVGYIDLPSYDSRFPESRYVTTGQHAIQQVDQPANCGWIVDLRRNQGGDMYPMIVAVGPILGEGKIGAFVDAHNHRTLWSYHNGGVYLDDQVIEKINYPYHLQHPMLPVAILTSYLTASAAEATLIAFQGRPYTRSFGLPTHGVPTGNKIHKLNDGAELVLTEVLEQDRTGRTYDASIPPNQTVSINWPQLDTRDDSVLLAAEHWLQSQGCH